MANLDVRGFIVPEREATGMYRAADAFARSQARADQQEQTRRAQSARYISEIPDSKDFLSGTNYDPEIVRQLGNAIQEGTAMAAQGADMPSIMMQIGPKINRLHEYSTKAKLINDRITKQMSLIPANSGYDKSKLENEAKRLAFYGSGTDLKDISTIDPDTDWLMETIKQFPEKVTNDSAIDEFVKNSPKFADTKDITAYEPGGGMSRKKVKITSPDWLIPDVDKNGAVTGLVPRYQTAIENGSPLMHDFVDEKSGKVVSEPVRLLEDSQFNSMMHQNPGIADWVRGQVNTYIKAHPSEDITPDSPQAKNLAKAILYDELKRRKGGSIEEVQINDKPSPQEIKINLGLGSGTPGNPTINDVYEGIRNDYLNKKGQGIAYLQGRDMKSEATDVIMDAVKKKGYNDLNQNDVKVKLDDKGNVEVYYSDEYLGKHAKNPEGNKRFDPLITTLTPKNVNIKTQPAAPEKRKVIALGEDQGKTPPSQNTNSYSYKGRTGSYQQLVAHFGQAEADRLIKSGEAKQQ